MFNTIEAETFQEIKNLLFEDHGGYYLNSREQLNRLFNAPYTAEAIKSDIMDIYLNSVYDDLFYF